MKRKKWTAQAEISKGGLNLREKKKWQLALRRYIIERVPSQFYAPYFGLSSEMFRDWIALQFVDELNWDNFGTAWQFAHIVPVSYFDFSNENDLRLCWSFINIQVEKLGSERKDGAKTIVNMKSYFENIYAITGLSICLKILDKINEIERNNNISDSLLISYIIDNKDDLEILPSLNQDEFARLNQGTALKDILLERQIIQRFG
jgi:hypothetical protein